MWSARHQAGGRISVAVSVIAMSQEAGPRTGIE
jgi:hypothetical protein